MPLCVFVSWDIQEIPSLNVPNLYKIIQLKDLNHARPVHVDQMLFVANKMELVLVHVYRNILEILMKDVVQNVSLIPIVLRTALVSETNVKIHVLALVAKMQIVKL